MKLRPVPEDLTVFGNELFFSAEDTTGGIELWKVTGNFTSNESITIAKKTSVYPNPTTDIINFERNKVDENYEIINLLGKVELSGKTNSKKSTIDISTLSNGVYFLKILSENNPFSQKIIKE